MTRCADCDAVLSERDKNTAGHWRPKCLPCMADSVEDFEPAKAEYGSREAFEEAVLRGDGP